MNRKTSKLLRAVSAKHSKPIMDETTGEFTGFVMSPFNAFKRMWKDLPHRDRGKFRRVLRDELQRDLVDMMMAEVAG